MKRGRKAKSDIPEVLLVDNSGPQEKQDWKSLYNSQNSVTKITG